VKPQRRLVRMKEDGRLAGSVLFLLMTNAQLLLHKNRIFDLWIRQLLDVSPLCCVAF